MSTPRIAVIGAGISGLIVANRLSTFADITVFEKSGGVGGRLATRYNNLKHQFDIGAQFFTAKTPEFQQYLTPFVERQILQIWQGTFIEINKSEISHSSQWTRQYPHYVPSPKMTSWCKDLATSLTVHLKTTIKKIESLASGVFLYDDNQTIFGPFDNIVLSIPVKQALDLLPNDSHLYTALTNYTMLACYSVSLGFAEPVVLPFASALIKQRDISFISHNCSKPGREHHAPSITVLSTNDYAERHQNTPKETIIDYLSHEAKQALQLNWPKPVYAYAHLWRYANAKKQTGPLAFLDKKNHIGICGDWCRQGIVEAAFLSANELANQLLSLY